MTQPQRAHRRAIADGEGPVARDGRRKLARRESRFPGGRLRDERAHLAREAPRSLGRLERRALSELDLDETADKAVIRARYTDLLKRLHPDVNQGDRSMEDKLVRVIRAFKTLKAAKLA